MRYETILYDVSDRIATITLNRPEAMYALSCGMLAGMYRAWRQLAEDPDLRVAILTGRAAAERPGSRA